ncbi:MAG: 16S rRNA (uracil(1498)-N(3))-methyltransferase [Proteobacteria bacterium]|nr:16S rRNA (uracil(1498)-N(3))-methyltransferase [Pseudomonadota bacterium]
MNLILLEPHEIDGRGRVVLIDRRARHICNVLRARPGDGVRIGAIRGPRGTGEIIDINSSPRVEMQVHWNRSPSPVPQIDLVLAVPRPKVLARTLRAAACLGVRRIDLVNAWRVDKNYFSSHELKPTSLRDNLLRGCEQAETTWLPDIDVHRLFTPFAQGPLNASVGPQRRSDEAERPGDRTSDRVRFVVAHPPAGRTIETVIAPGTSASIVAAIGPERGWIDGEIKALVQLGAVPVTLSAHVLSVETVVASLLSQVELLRRLPTSSDYLLDS